MKTAGWTLLKSLLNRLPSEEQGHLIHFLNTEGIRHLEEVSPAMQLTQPPLHAKIDEIHYSWFIPLLESYSLHDQFLLISSLNSDPAEKLLNHFKIPDKKLRLHPLVTAFGKKALYNHLTSEKKEFLPTHLLPESPLKPLLDLSKQELTTLIDYLGLRDLSTDYPQLVQATHIKWIKDMLSREEAEYFYQLLTHKEPVIFAPLHLDQWDGNQDTLKKVLHQRGLNRLGKALFGCHPSFFWHLSHLLDVGRAKILHKLSNDTKNPKVQSVLSHQVIELIPKVKRKP
ncbi:MAG: hypothetical protein KBC64_05655 [Simkaniaceae bacterium]|nr:hypothetical protein [Simkaniaceae bacterium]